MKINESDFEYKGYRCVTTFTDMGERCGYVGLPKDHPLYGKRNGSQLKITIKEARENQEEENKRGVIPLFGFFDDEDNQITLGTYFNVHGGITYTNGNGKHPVESDLWWLGFDCGHYGDGKDLYLVEKLWGDNENIKKRIESEKTYDYWSEYPVKSLEYVQQECRNLIEQIIYLIENYY